MRHRLGTLIIKELLAILRDPKGRTVLIMPPLIQLFVFSFAATQEAKNVTLAVLNRDHGLMGTELVERFRAARTFTHLISLESETHIRSTLDRQQALAVLVIGQDFSRDILAHRPTCVQFLLDGRKTNAAQIVSGYGARIVQTFQQDMVGQQGTVPVTMAVRHWFNPNLDFKWYTVPSLVAVISTLIGLLVTSLSVAREREMGTFDQLIVSPLRPLEILLGKAGAALLVAVAEGSLILGAAVWVFRIPFQGSLVLLYGAMTLFLLSIIGVGLFISALSLTQQQAILGAFTFMTPAMLLSGFATPIENMPPWLQVVTLGNPLRWFLVIVRGVFLKAMPASDVLANAWPLVIIAIVTLLAAVWLFRHRME
ncbi:MAG: ABC transporter permease [Planctomycetota bacterium]